MEIKKFSIPSFKEDHISQVPALQLLVNIGYTYLTPEEAEALRSQFATSKGGRGGRIRRCET